MYQRIGAAAYRVDLSNTLKLCDHLERPQDFFRSVHVAGTNGKGSTSHMLASVLQEAGYKTGLYTSPHLKDFRERIRIAKISPDEGMESRSILERELLIYERIYGCLHPSTEDSELAELYPNVPILYRVKNQAAA